MAWALACAAGCGAEGAEGGAVVRLTRVEGPSAVSMRTAVGTGGDIWVLMFMTHVSDLGSGPLGDERLTVQSLVLARFDSEHRHVWSRQIGAPFSTQVRLGLTLLAGDPVITLEGVSGELSLGGDVLEGPDVPESTGAMARYSSEDGRHLWSRLLVGGEPAARIHPQDIIASGERIYLVGSGQRQGEIPSGVVAAYEGDGSEAWLVAPWEGTFMQGSRIALAGDGSLVVTADNAFSLNERTAAVLRLESDDGALRWSAACPHNYSGDMQVVVTPAGDVVTAETVFVTDDFSGMSNVYSVDRLAGGDGAHQWSWILGTGLSLDNVFDVHIAADAEDRIVVSGVFLGTVLLGERVLRSSRQALFVMSLDAAGEARWSRYAGRTPVVKATDVHVTPADTVLATGFVSTSSAPDPDDTLFFLELSP